MSQLWKDCMEAGPLAALPPDKTQRLEKRFREFYSTFKCFRSVLRDQHTTLESYHEFQQTWDECIDFLYHSRKGGVEGAIPQATLLHETASYVYNTSDLDLLERRLDLQLQIMHAKLDDIFLQSELHRTAHGALNEVADLYEDKFPEANKSVDRNTNSLFEHLIELHEALKRSKALPLKSEHLERIWRRIVNRFSEHAPPNSEGLQWMSLTRLKESDRKRLIEYSRQTLKRRQSIYRSQESSSPLRRRVYDSGRKDSLATIQRDLLEDEQQLFSVDVVTHLGHRSVVSTRIDREWGFVHYREYLFGYLVIGISSCQLELFKVPIPSNIHPYTKHACFHTAEIRLYEASTIEEGDGAKTWWRHEGRKPTYRFGSKAIDTAFQCALRGKLLMHTLQIDDILSEQGSEATAQPLKLWSDIDGRRRSMTFLLQREKPYRHVEISLRLFDTSVDISNSGKKIKLRFVPLKSRKGRNSGSGTTLLRRVSYRLRRSSAEMELNSNRRGSYDTMSSVNEDEELPQQDTELFASFGYLQFRFSDAKDALVFQKYLSSYFSETRSTNPPMSIPHENSDGIEPPALRTPVYGSPNPFQSEKEQISPDSSDHAGHQSAPQSPLDQRSGNDHTPTNGSSSAKRPKTLPLVKDLDYRVRGIKLEHTGPNILAYLRSKLGIESTVVGRVKALATSQNGDKVAVVAWRPQPKCLSAPGKDEWEFGPTSDDDSLHITVDTHFRGVTILYSPPPEKPHTIDICAVAGLGGHAWGSFKHKGEAQSFMWVLDGLREKFPTARLMTYGSKTKLDGNESTQTLEDLGKLLRDEMRSVTRRPAQSGLSKESCSTGPSSSVPSIFIAHSLGGLTVKEALLQEETNPDKETFLSNLKGALFFGVPSHGMNIQVLEAMIRGQPNELLVRSIANDSPTLQELSRRFKATFPPGKPKIIYFYELELSGSPRKAEDGQWKMDGPKTFLVARISATDGGLCNSDYVDTRGLNRNHSDLVKFSSPNDADYRRVLEDLEKMVKQFQIRTDVSG
ncbi:Uncharacterized protein PECH_006351 [Penicillium ucsense]|uniref:DUF676 domain-containing protein n=1 Tax=Penicillium ucsense TaxID=2839758 RepID=A0A8J8W8Z8_9EURO|nr:Uncharacterized protein PECM_001482 [Penicillium ucsense]KAF7739143.1 Uncharacterized protein PECH_006351 [Penicillium ucsense]